MSGAGAAVRAFVALEIEPRVREAIARLMVDLRPRVPGARWVRPETLHLTLRFLAAASPLQLERLRPALATAAAGCPVSGALVAGLGTFPERSSPRVLWLGLDVPPEVYALQEACERSAVQAGFPRETRPFRAHLTLARFRERVTRPPLPPADLGVARLDSLVLFRSELRPEGAVHTPLFRWALGGEG